MFASYQPPKCTKTIHKTIQKKKKKKKEETKTDQIQLKELSTFFLFIAMDFEFVNHQYVQFLFLFFTNYLTNKESGTFDNTAPI